MSLESNTYLMNYEIRKTEIKDMGAIMDAHKRSIRELCSKDYTDDQIERWSDVNYSEDIWDNSVNNEFHLCVEVNGRVEGLCHAKVDEDGVGHIVGLYFTKMISGKGIGKEVFQKAMDYIKSAKVSKVNIIGTITAKGFYEKMGFHVVEKRQLTTRGTTLDCYKMELILDE